MARTRLQMKNILFSALAKIMINTLAKSGQSSLQHVELREIQSIKGGMFWKYFLLFILVLNVLVLSRPVHAEHFSYENTSSGTIPDNGCGSGTYLSRTFSVTDSFTVADVNLGFVADHSYRGDIRLQLTSPSGTTVTLINESGTARWNYDIWLNDHSSTTVNTGFNDSDNDSSLTPYYYEHSVKPNNPFSSFIGQSSSGTWTIRMCDSYSGDVGVFQRARLTLFDGNTGSASAPSTPMSCGADVKSFNWNSVDLTAGNLNQTFTNVDGSGVDVSWALTGRTDLLIDNTPDDSASFNGGGGVGGGGESYYLVVDPPNSSTTSPVTTTVSFTQPVTDLRFSVYDIDSSNPSSSANGRVDKITVTGTDGTNSYTPALVAANINPSFHVTGNVAEAPVEFDSQSNNNNRGTVDVYFSQPVTSVSITYEEGGNAPDPYARGASISSMQFCAGQKDYGDAPISGTAPNGSDPVSYGEAVHNIKDGYYLGSGEPDADSGNQPSVGADGDDNDGTDDEDGVTLPALIQGQSATISATVAGTGGYLQGWIDFDGNGTFDAGEQVATDIQDGGAGDTDGAANGTITFNVSVPATATTNQTYARFRWSTTAGLGSTSAANDGEVEDYAVTIAAPVIVNCPTEGIGAGSGYATSGTGLYKNDIFWLDWSCGSVTQFNPGDIVSKSWTLGNGLQINAQLSAITAAIEPYNTGNWGGDILDDLYGGVNPIGLRNVIATQDPTYTISFTASLNGISIPADVVAAEAEDTGNINESATWTTDGSAWQPIDAAGYLDAQFSNAGKTVFMSEVADSGGGTLLAFSRDVSNIAVDMQAGGNEAIAFGVFSSFDYGDIAAGYPASQGHYMRKTASDGSTPSTLTPVSSLTLATLANTTSYYLGANQPDADTGDQNSTNADGDDSHNTDDEDGITIPTLTQGQTAPITATIHGSGGYLQGWIDWNGDGDFADAGEQIAANLQDNGTGDTDATAGTVTFAVSVPATATLNQTYARFRWSSTQNLDATTAASDGEVEDYAVTIIGNDYGDAPGYGDAAHSVDGLTYMGTVPDVDPASKTANGDASDDAHDDGVFTDAGLSTGLQGASLNLEQSLTLHIPVSGTGKLYAWIDWNHNGSFADAGEQIASGVDGTDQTLSVVVNVPLNAAQGITYARFRFADNDTAASTPTGTSGGNGEVEDYQVVIANNPTPPTATPLGACSGTWAAGGGGYQSTTAQGVQITASGTAGSSSSWSFAPNDALNTSGVFSLPELNGAPSLSSVFTWDTSPEDGRSANAATDGQTGTLTFSFNTPVKNPIIHIDRLGGYGGNSGASPQQLSNSASITPNAANASASFTALAGTTHFEVTSNSIQRTPNETLVWGQATSESGTDSSRNTAMGSVQINGTFSTLKLDLKGVGVEGAGADGIEFVVCAYPYDYGDAPASYGDADHRLPDTNNVYLGTVKGEGDPQTQNTANGGSDGTGDDTDGSDDEDGVANFPALTTGAQDYSLNVAVNNTSGSTARLVGWIDFDGSGSFDSDEATTVNIASGASNKIVALTWNNLPGDIQPGNTYVRLRLTTDSSIATGTASTSQPTGTADDGEVEDYPLTIGNGGYTVSGTVYHDSNVNGTNDSETGLKDVTVVLYDTANGTCRSTKTGADGNYSFSGVQPAAANNYVLYEAASENHSTPDACPPTAADPNGYLSSTANTRTLTLSNADVTGQDYGDVQAPSFTLDNSQVILPNTTVAYPHIFRSSVDGTVSFTVTASADPANLTWGTSLYRDNNCDATLDSTDTAITNSITVNAGDKLCILTKVLAPANATAGAEHTLSITSNFSYGDASLISSPAEQTRTDITRTASGASSAPPGGEGKLALVKSVWNASRGSTVGDNDGSVALPGETLRYTIHYENIGNGELDELVVHDNVPVFTQMGGAGQQCGTTPPELSACTTSELNDVLGWTFAGKLQPGSSGEVFYEAVVK